MPGGKGDQWAGGSGVNGDQGAGAVLPLPRDPLSDSSWAEEMESEAEKGLKRVASTPPEDNRTRLKQKSVTETQQISDLKLKRGQVYEVSIEGGSITGKLVKVDGTHVYLDTNLGRQHFNLRGQPERIRVLPRKNSA